MRIHFPQQWLEKIDQSMGPQTLWHFIYAFTLGNSNAQNNCRHLTPPHTPLFNKIL